MKVLNMWATLTLTICVAVYCQVRLLWYFSVSPQSIACSLLLVLLSCSIPPPTAAATYRAGGRHSPTRSRPNFPLKTFPKIIRDFSAIESGVRPPLGRKLAPHSTGGKAKKCRKMKSQDGGGSVVAVVPRNCNSLKTANSKCVFVAQWKQRTRTTTCCKEGRQKSFPMMMATSSQRRRRMLHTSSTGHTQLRRLRVRE